jgi:phosphoglycolate phosphatase-like HAD superfamily hydrolase
MIRALNDEETKQKALEIVYEEEMLGIQRQILRNNCFSVIHSIYSSHLRLALCTRNCQASYLDFLKQSKIHSHYFIPAMFRENIVPPTNQKPNPELARSILSTWSILPGQEKLIWFVGDSIDDMKCGKHAGLTTCLVLTPENHHLPKIFPELIDHVVHNLEEILVLLDIPHKM